jgi:hypothetical protein
MPPRSGCSARSLPGAGLIEKLFDHVDRHLAAKGYIARSGQMVDATMCRVLRSATVVMRTRR